VVEALGANDAVSDAVSLELALDLRKQFEGPSAGGVGIDEQQMATVRGDRLNLLTAQAGRRARK
jgi:hypothetical protein